MRVAIGGVQHESMTFSPVPTTLDSFSIHVGEQLIDDYQETNTEIAGFLDVASRGEFTAIPILMAFAFPSGTVQQDAIEALEERLLAGIAATPQNGGLDGVLLALHGAMVTEVSDDGEGHILRRVRELIGPDTPLVATLDWHCYLSQEMMDCADALVTYDTWPHIDLRERGVEAAEILVKLLRREILPTAARCHPPMLIAGPTAYDKRPPMKTVMGRAHEIERDPRVITLTIAPGFSYTDIPHAGAYTYVLTDNDPALAQQYADELGQLMWDLRHDFLPQLVSPEEAVRRAMDAPRGPVLLVDQGDVPSGGSPGDGTTLLRLLLEAGATNAACAFSDQVAVQEAMAAGAGARVTLTVGAKHDALHGTPVTVDAVVRTISDGSLRLTGPVMTGVEASMGPTVVLDVEGIEIVLTTERVATVDQAIFHSQGIDPSKKKILLIKSSLLYHAAFAPIAAEIIDVDTPGLTTPRVGRLPYTRLARAIFPLDDVRWSAS